MSGSIWRSTSISTSARQLANLVHTQLWQVQRGSSSTPSLGWVGEDRIDLGSPLAILPVLEGLLCDPARCKGESGTHALVDGESLGENER